MAQYTVNYEAVQTSIVSELNLSLDYIANVTADVRIYVDGSLLNYPADYSISNIAQFPYYTTFKVTFLNAIQIGQTLRIEKNEEWNQWIQFKFPNLEDRIAVLEGKLTTASNVAARLTTLETNLSSVQSDIVTLNSLVSGHNGRITNAEIDITNLQNAVVNIALDVSNLKAFMGVEGEVAINNNQSAPLTLDDFTFDGYQLTSVKVDYEIMRRTGADYKSSVGSMYLVCKDNGVWFTERGLQVIDMDGVSFSIATDVNRVCTFSYTSDLLAGAGYQGYFKYRITKFEV